MPTTPPEKSSSVLCLDLLDLDLPVSEVPWPARHEISPDAVYAMNAEMWKTQVLDEAYWAWSLAGKNPEPFVM